MDSIQLNSLKKELVAQKDPFILDFRSQQEFDDGFIVGSIYIGKNLNRYHRYLKSFTNQSLYIVHNSEIEETVLALNKLGFEKIRLVTGTIDAHSLSEVGLLDLIITIEADELAMDLPFDDKARIIDLRQEDIYKSGHIEDAENIPLEEFMDVGTIAEMEEQENIYLFSNEDDTTFAGSLIKRQGLHNFRKIKGGMQEISNTEKIKIVKDTKEPIK